ncbi:probable serine/threonine-protein kinase DDB_G0282963 isoform X2 [Bactrocera neohumeralis]|uniref:probable serine/threonine-protein kinase DDB_G0282963 isoform X2 n=1 Tax=Bactrocera neohumeralis TaxID=98809 RepID=UPI0021661EDC|nr:probable serine/threonine-protein kinase DDB_G0282963 isoform X2 [Bactrocera neohumeralis]
MAGIPPIPPLLCNTPPPIDFGEEDDDSGLPPTLTLEDEDDYADFALGTDINEDTTNAEVSSLPRTPLQFELSSSTTSGFTDIPPALEDLGPISLNSSEFNNSTANQEVKTQTQLNEAFNYNVTQKFALDSDYTETTGTEGELKPINNSDAPSAQKFVTDCKQLDSDANEAKEKTTTSTTQTQPLSVAVILSEITAKPDSQIEDSDVAAKDLETEVKKDFMPTNSESPPPLPELVLLEDLDDDSSDEECHRSPKKSPISPTAPLEDHVDNDSEDFFAIHLVNTPPSPKEEKISTLADDINMNNSSNHNNNITNDLPKTENVNLNGREEQDDDFGDFADFETASNFINPPDNGGLVTTDLITTSVVDSNQNMRDLVEPPADTAIIAEDDDDFDDFQNFSSAPAPTPTPTVVPIISAPNSLSITVEHNNNNAQSAALKTGGVEENEFEANSFDNDDDDDFGDFEEASYETPATQITATTPAVQTPTKLSTQTTANGNIGDRLGTVLKIMFPTEEASPVDDDELQQAAKVNKINDTLPFEAIEAAKALEFQWPQSEMRHALIRSIGIDSRNILFGDNWNPSMPRFAANLSFNPLKPMKPQTTIAVPNTTYADADSMQYSINNSGSAAEPDMGNYAKKMDVPDVEFDWQGAGLVNPLDGAKGETNARETEAVQPPPPVARLDTPDDEHQSHTTATNVGVNISETLSKNDNELTATPTRDACPSPLALDNAAYQFTTAESGINSISSSTSGSSINNSKPYDNSKTMTTLRLGANIVVDDDDETVVTSTYAGPLKETHIYTPSKTDVAITMKAGKAAVGGSEPIDFDYEIAAAGIIIDEKVVKKEYRDVEYNPGFSLEMVAEYTGELPMGAPSTLVSEPSAVSVQIPAQQQTTEFDTDEFTEFTEFQSVPPPPKATVPAADTHFGNSLSASTITSKFPAEINAKTTLNTLPAVLPAAVSKTKETSNTPSRTSSPSVVDNMILSPAILLPQAIPISTNNTATSKTTPTIEWGDSTANINPDELARIEELFAQPKIPAAAKDVNTSQKASPLHTYAEKHTKNNSISISASVALKEQDSTLNDDYWSEFVSVPVTPQLPTNASRLNNNNNNNNNSNNKSNNNNQLVITPKRITDVHINSANNSNNAMRSPRHQQPNINAQRTLTPTPQHKSTAHASANSAHISARSNAYNSNSNTNSNSNDDDWSDFVSSTPTPTSAATQQQHVASYMPATHAPQFNSAAWQNANFYNNPLGLYHQQAAIQTRTSPLTPQQQQLQLQQQIHIMQDFSTAPVTNRPQNALNNSNNANVNHMQQHSNTTYSPLQVGSARVAPSISLIPDLGFVAPALPVHTAFVNVLPKTSFNSKK